MPRAPKEKTATRNKRPLKKEKHFTDESCIELCTCAKTMQQDKAAAKPPKTNQHEGKLLQSGWVQVKSLQKALQQNHAFCAQIGIENSG